MTVPFDDVGLAAWLDASGLDLPEDLRAGVIAGCRALLGMTAVLRTVPLVPEDEPAGAFRLRASRNDDPAA